MEPAIETRALHRAFGQAIAVDRLDLQVEQGTFFGFLGPNGAGKSTTIKMLTGLLDPTSGSSSVLGFDVVEEPVQVKQRIGVVPEELALFDRLTGAEYLRFVGRMYGMTRETIEERSAELLELMELQDEPKKLIVDYSHGMKKKLSFSAALIHGPEVVFLDEPFEGIDAVSSRLIKTILNQLLASGVTIFLTSHILEIVEKLCSHVAIIDHGRIVAHGSLDELRNGVSLDENGDGTRRTLEELFISLVGGADQERGLSWLV
jgi:ABC-2 type transport system ATP-binding protein